jgi:predicted metallopeptidase
MKYEFAEDLQKKAEEISKAIFPHIDITRIKCFRSYGTSSRGTIARCHSLEKLLQRALGIRPFYVLEFLSERFDRLGEEEKIKVIIHELMHIPQGFGGGFKHHDFVNERNIKKLHYLYLEKTKSEKGKNEEKKSWFNL